VLRTFEPNFNHSFATNISVLRTLTRTQFINPTLDSLLYNNMLIYSHKITSRLAYIFRFIFTEILGMEVEFTDDADYFISYKGYKFNYSSEKIDASMQIIPIILLFETGIWNQQTDVIICREMKGFFRTESNFGFTFDLFAASFYLLTRYEEYLPFQPDLHGRFPAEQSLAYKNDFLNIPVINTWVEALKDALLQYYPDLKLKENKFRHISTIDVDNAFAYRGKGLLRTIAGYAKALMKTDAKAMAWRTKVLLGKAKDPFDCYSLQEEIKNKYGLEMIYFILFAQRTDHDGCALPESNAYQQLVKKLSAFAEIGIHPSYYSKENPEMLETELKLLEHATGKAITKSRQHFLRLSFPETYRRLINAGISEDYSMGYASHPGFRAGVCTPFNYYDLPEEKETALKVYPFAAMDITFSDYMKIQPEDALKHISTIIHEIKKINGLFISIWHDRTFNERWEYKGWKDIYIRMMEMITPIEND